MPPSRSQSSWWPLALLGTLVFALFVPRNQNKNATQTVHPQKTPNHKREQVDSAIAANVPPAIAECKYPYRSKDETPIWKKAVEITLAVSTAGLLLVNIFLWLSTDKSANTAHDALVLSQRPWVHEKSFRITKPLEFNANGDASMEIAGILENDGNSPALQARSNSFLSILTMTKMENEEITEKQEALCDPLRSQTRQLLDMSIFRGDDAPVGEGVSLSSKEIRVATEARSAGPSRHDGYVSLILITCVDYQMSLTSEHHQTRYAFNLGIPLPSGGFMGDVRPEGTYPNVALIYFSQSAD